MKKDLIVQFSALFSRPS